MRQAGWLRNTFDASRFVTSECLLPDALYNPYTPDYGYERLFGGVLSDFRSSPISRPVSPLGAFTALNFRLRYGPAERRRPNLLPNSAP